MVFGCPPGLGVNENSTLVASFLCAARDLGNAKGNNSSEVRFPKAFQLLKQEKKGKPRQIALYNTQDLILYWSANQSKIKNGLDQLQAQYDELIKRQKDLRKKRADLDSSDDDDEAEIKEVDEELKLVKKDIQETGKKLTRHKQRW